MIEYQLINTSKSISAAEISETEKLTGETFPASLNRFYLQFNGGEVEDERCVYRNSETGVEFNVNTFLPIKYKRFNDDYLLEECTLHYIREKKFVPAGFICFAIDDGGYPYCIKTADDKIYLCYVSDILDGESPMRYIAPTLEEFINGMMTEDEAYG